MLQLLLRDLCRVLRALVFLLLFGGGLGFAQEPSRAATSKPRLPVYVYDSLLGDGSLGEFVEQRFEQRCGCDLQWVPVGSGAQLVSRISLDAERGRWSGAVAWGVDTLTATELAHLAAPWTPTTTPDQHLLRALQKEWGLSPSLSFFVPVDFGELAWIFDDRKIPRSRALQWKTWGDFFQGTQSQKLLLQDPRTSALGLQLVLGVDSGWGQRGSASASEALSFWKKLRSRWRTLAPSWSSAYGLFLKGEAAGVWSYATSEAYHRERDRRKGTQDGASFYAWIPEDGTPIQLEGVMGVQGIRTFTPEVQALAWQFVQFLLTPEVQAEVGARQWMRPVRREVSQPASFKTLPKAKRGQVLRPRSAHEIREAVARWERALRGAHNE